MSLTEKQKHDLKKFIKELEGYRGRHTELVSVYVPQGYDMVKIIQHIQQEQGTAMNIKSASTRKNVTGALERMVQHLRLYSRTPENGLAVFSGNIAPEGQQDFKVWSIEPPIPLQTRIYRCDKDFALDLLRDMLATKETYGLVVMDRREAVIAELRGKSINVLSKHTSNVPGKFKAGGQCCIPSTLIIAANGEIIPIGESHNPYVLKSVDIAAGSIADSPITAKWEVKKKIAHKIVTASPRIEIETSSDHVFFVSTSEGIIEKPADQLKPGEFLIMPEKIDVAGEPQKLSSRKYYNSFVISKLGQQLLKKKRLKRGLLQGQLAERLGTFQATISSYELGKLNAEREPLRKLCTELGIDFDSFLAQFTIPKHYMGVEVQLPEVLTPELAQFLGYFLGDGSLEEDRIVFFEQNRQVALAYKEKFDGFFNLKGSHKFRESKNYHQIRFTSRPLVRLIKNEFPELKQHSNQKIPKKVLLSDNKVVAAFLRGLFDAEGYVSGAKVALGMNNRTLIQQVQLALLRFGVLASFLEYDNRRNPYSRKHRFTLELSEKESLKRFREAISFTSVIKSEKLDMVIIRKVDKSTVRQIITPGAKVREIVEKAGYLHKTFPRVSGFFRNGRMMSKQVFKSSIMERVKDKGIYEKLEQIYQLPLLPVKISRIELIKKEMPMVDISVRNQNFIANGVLVHNSAQRFMRLREGAAKDFYSRLGEHVKEAFFHNEFLKGIIIGGPGPTKYEFIEGSFIPTDLKNKIIAVKDITYTDEFGLHDLVDKSQDVLAAEELADEKKFVNRFFGYLVTKPGLASYGEQQVLGVIRQGAVDTLLLSESLPEEKIEMFEAEAKEMGSAVMIISAETREGAQLKDFGGIAAILRYEVHGEN